MALKDNVIIDIKGNAHKYPDWYQTYLWLRDCGITGDLADKVLQALPYDPVKLPNSDFKTILRTYLSEDCTTALYKLMRFRGKVTQVSPLGNLLNPVQLEDVEYYTKFVPKKELKRLVYHLLFCMDNVYYSLYSVPITIEDFFNKCYAMGLMNFDPYVNTDADNPVLVLRWNLALMFDGKYWLVRNTRHATAIRYISDINFLRRGSQFPKTFTATAFYADMLNVGLRYPEFKELLSENTEMVDKFCRDVAAYWSLPTPACKYQEMFVSCLTVCNSTCNTDLRLCLDSETDAARLGILDVLSGFIELPNGIRSLTVKYDFEHLLKLEGKSKYAVEGDLRTLGRALFQGLLAISGVYCWSESIEADYSFPKGSVPVAQHKAIYKIKDIEEFSIDD